MIFGYVYKITNIVNNKCYIGQTTKSIEHRFKTHKQRVKYKSQKGMNITKAIRKYGEKNFIIEEIDRANNIEELNSKEVYWIAKCNSINNGYNLDIGGNSKGPRALETKIKISKTLKKRDMPKCLIPYLGHRKGKTQSKQSIEKMKHNMPTKKAVTCIKDNKVIAIFNTIAEAAQWLGKSTHKSNIVQCCKGRAKSVGGYNWKYGKDL